MKRHRKPRLLSAVIALFLSLWAGAASADVVTAWNDHLLAVTAAPSVNRPNPEIGAASAYMHIAMYDAISSIDGNYRPFATHVADAPAGASREAAAIEAAYRIVAYLYPAAVISRTRHAIREFLRAGHGGGFKRPGEDGWNGSRSGRGERAYRVASKRRLSGERPVHVSAARTRCLSENTRTGRHHCDVCRTGHSVDEAIQALCDDRA